MTDARAQQDAHHPVVVGVDGSASARQALTWAARYAALAGLPLAPIVVWHMPASLGYAVPLPSDWDPQGDARGLLEHELLPVLVESPSVEVHGSVLEGPPAQVLIDASKTASLVVVGNRGRGELSGLVLGSVSAHLVAHAHCPVVVVRDCKQPVVAS